MTLVVQLNVPDGWPVHVTWAAMALAIAMHIRMSRFSLLPGQSVEQLVTRVEELRPQINVLGARAVHLVQMGENEFCLVAIYESKSAADHVLEHVKQVWGQFGNVIDLKTMKIDSGDVVWNY